MDSREARELLEAMRGAGPTWTWELHPDRADLNGMAHEAEVVSEQMAAFIFRRVADAWEDGKYPSDVTVTVRVDLHIT